MGKQEVRLSETERGGGKNATVQGDGGQQKRGKSSDHLIRKKVFMPFAGEKDQNRTEEGKSKEN